MTRGAARIRGGSLRPILFFSCEHGGNRIPAPLRPLFRGSRLLASHRGIDVGALHSARILAAELEAPLFYSDVSRLVVDLNRSLGSPSLHCARIQALPEQERRAIVYEHYTPYRRTVAEHVASAVKHGTAIHLSIHSFAPVFRGEVRDCDIGLLFDPARPTEARFARELGRRLSSALPDLRVRSNQPYQGTDDGHTTDLRKLHPESRYVGIEIEFNQRRMKRWMKSGRLAREMSAASAAIRSVMESC